MLVNSTQAPEEQKEKGPSTGCCRNQGKGKGGLIYWHHLSPGQPAAVQGAGVGGDGVGRFRCLAYSGRDFKRGGGNGRLGLLFRSGLCS